MRFIVLVMLGIVLCVAVSGAISISFWSQSARFPSGTRVRIADDCMNGEMRCVDNSVVRCFDRTWYTVRNCNEFQQCDVRMGCVRTYRTSTEIVERDPKTCPRWRPYQKPVPGCG